MSQKSGNQEGAKQGTPGDERFDTELLSVKSVASGLGCSPRHVRRLSDAGRMPRPVRLGALIRWRRDELERWVAAGCPNLREAR